MSGTKNQKSTAMSALYAMLIIAALFLAVFGGKIYSAVTANREQNNSRRGTVAYIQSKLSSADSFGGVQTGDGPQGDLLILREGDSGYETRIYLYDGWLMEEFSKTGSQIAPAAAQAICEASTFSVRPVSDGLLLISADGATALAAIKSAGGVADE